MISFFNWNFERHSFSLFRAVRETCCRKCFGHRAQLFHNSMGTALTKGATRGDEADVLVFSQFSKELNRWRQLDHSKPLKVADTE